jgi:phospholipase/carboxylesterase
MANMRKERFGELDVVLSGGTDGHGGGDGPLVVLLHGFGAPGTDLVPLAQPHLLPVPRGVRFAFPAAPLSLSAVPNVGFGMGDSRAWWLIDIERFQVELLSGRAERLTEEVPQGLAAARKSLLVTLETLEQKLGVSPGKMVLGGFSQGAMLSMDVILRSGRTFAGAVLWSGTIICAHEWQPLYSRTAGLPMVQSHGVLDPLLPFEQAERLRDHLQAAQAKHGFIAFRGGHEIPPTVLSRTATFLTQILS